MDRKRDKCGVTIVEQLRQTNSDEHQEKPARLNEPQREQSGTVEDSNVVDLTSQSDNSEVFIGGLVGVSSASKLDDTVPLFFSIEDIISVAFTTSSPVLVDDIHRAVHSSAHCDQLSEVQLNAAVPVFTPTNEAFSVALSTSTPVSGDHDQHADDNSNFDVGFDQHYVSLKLHRANLLEEMICQFKDESIRKYPLKFAFINERGADADGVSSRAERFLAIHIDFFFFSKLY